LSVAEPDVVKHVGGAAAGPSGSHTSISVKVYPAGEHDPSFDSIDTQLENPLFGTRGGATHRDIARLLQLNDTMNFDHSDHHKMLLEHNSRPSSTSPNRCPAP